MTKSPRIRKASVWLACALAALAVLYVVLVATGTIGWPGAWQEEDLATIPNVGGLSFRITYTNSDTFAKQEAVSVYASPTESKEGSWLRRRLGRNTLLFRYDPSGKDKTLPSITSASGNRIMISVPEVSSVLFERAEWRGISFDYKIGRAAYP